MFQDLQDALLKGEKADVETLVDKALSEGVPAERILNEGLIPGMETVGVLFRNSEIFIPEVLVAARAMNAGLTRLEPVLVRDKVQPKGVVVIGTAKGDLHDIGKNLVAMMLKGAGYRIVDLGIDVAPETIRRSGPGRRGGDHRLLGPPDDDHGPDEEPCRSRPGGRARDPRDHRGGPGDEGIRGPDRRPGLRRRRGRSGRRGRPASVLSSRGQSRVGAADEPRVIPAS